MNKVKEDLNKSHEHALKRLDKELANAKFTTIISLLNEKGIQINDNIKDLKSLKRYLKTNLNKHEWPIIDRIFKQADIEFKKTIEELKSGSTDAFSNFLNNLQNIVSPLTKGIINTLAIRSAMTLTPTITLKLALSSLIILRSTIKINKNIKYKNIIDQNYECNIILRKLETTLDNNNKIIDTRFNESIIKLIKEFLNNNKITYPDTGYLSIRNCIYNLPLNKKIALINLINNMQGNNIDIRDHLAKYNENLQEKFKKNFIKPIALGGAIGLGIATSINAIEPGILAGPVNGTLLGSILQKLTDSKVTSWIVGLSTGIGSSFLKYIPVVGEGLENMMAYENAIITSVIGGVANLGINTLKITGQGIKNNVNKIQSNKEFSDILKLDAKLHEKENIQELKERRQYYEINGATEEEKAIMLLVIKFMEENNIKQYLKINSISDLKRCIELLEQKERKKVYKFLNELENLRKNNYSYFIKLMNNIGNTLFFCASLSLASLSIIDLIKEGDYLNDIANKIFNKEQPLPLLEGEININDNMLELSDGIKLEPTPQPTPRPTPTPKPKPVAGPRPTPTPRPTPSPTPSITPRPSSQATTQPLPMGSLTDLQDKYINFLNNQEKFIENLTTLSGEDIYHNLYDYSQINEKIIHKCCENMDYDTISRIHNYLVNNPVENFDQYNEIIKNILNKRIIILNDEITQRANISNAITNATTLASLPVESSYAYINRIE